MVVTSRDVVAVKDEGSRVDGSVHSKILGLESGQYTQVFQHSIIACHGLQSQTELN